MAKAQCKEMSIKITYAAKWLLTPRRELNFLRAFLQKQQHVHFEGILLGRETDIVAGPYTENAKTENSKTKQLIFLFQFFNEHYWRWELLRWKPFEVQFNRITISALSLLQVYSSKFVEWYLFSLNF